MKKSISKNDAFLMILGAYEGTIEYDVDPKIFLQTVGKIIAMTEILKDSESKNEPTSI